MRIVTWNLNYWQSRSTHEEAWGHLRTRVEPDLAFLQEVRPPEPAPGEALVFREVRDGWGTAVYARGLPLEDVPLCDEYPGRVAGAIVSLPDGRPVQVASLHAYSNRVFPRLARMMEAVLEAFPDGPAIVGGDLNTARLAEGVWPDHGHGEFWRWIEGSRLVDCTQRVHGRELRTFFREGAVHPFQDDHLFVSRDLAPGLEACDVIRTAVTRRVSDHIPLFAELAL